MEVGEWRWPGEGEEVCVRLVRVYLVKSAYTLAWCMEWV